MELNPRLMGITMGIILTGTALVLLALFHLGVRKNPKYAIGRLFLKRNETIRAFGSLVIGTSILGIGRIFALCYSLNLIRYSLYFMAGVVSGIGLNICFLYAFYKILMTIRVSKIQT